MNLVLSGPIDVTLRNLIVTLSKPRQVVALHARADRLVGVDDADATRVQVAALCDAARVDHAYIEEGVRFADFKLLAMDMDSTLITIECIDEIADFAGKKAEVAAITEAAMRGELDFSESLRRRVKLLAGVSSNVLQDVLKTRLELTHGAEQVIQLAKTIGMHILIVSGGFTYFSDALKLRLGLSDSVANMLEIINSKLTGNIIGTIVDQYAKAKLVREKMIFLNCDKSQTLVIGDGSNDIPMMKETKHAIAYHGKPLTRLSASYCIDFGTFITLLDYFPSDG